MKIRSKTKYIYTFYAEYKRPHKNFAFELMDVISDQGVDVMGTYSVDESLWYLGKVRYTTKDYIEILKHILQGLMNAEIIIKYK